jgi:hypothetical protein
MRTLTGAGILIMGVLPAMDHSSAAALDPTGSCFWLLVAATILAAVVFTAIDEVVQRRLGADPVGTAARRAREVDDLVNPGWQRRVLRMGFLMGLGIGIPVGSVLALRMQEAVVVMDRLQLFGLFLLGTFVWTIPTAFVLRWLFLLGLRRRGLLRSS